MSDVRPVFESCFAWMIAFAIHVSAVGWLFAAQTHQLTDQDHAIEVEIVAASTSETQDENVQSIAAAPDLTEVAQDSRVGSIAAQIAMLTEELTPVPYENNNEAGEQSSEAQKAPLAEERATQQEPVSTQHVDLPTKKVEKVQNIAMLNANDQ